MNRVLLGALVVAMLVLTGLTAYNVFAPADDGSQFRPEVVSTEVKTQSCSAEQAMPCCAGDNAACTAATAVKAETPAEETKDNK